MDVVTLVKVLKYAPFKIDGKIYFSILSTDPAGGLRQRGGDRVVSYIDPLSVKGFHREVEEFGHRIEWPSYTELQTLLDRLSPYFYRVVPIHPEGRADQAISLVLVRSQSSHDGLTDRDCRAIHSIIDTTSLPEKDPILHLASEMVDSAHLSRRFVETFDLYNRCCR